ncbi:MAG: AAA family ATPase [Bryobacterales bacterium]|nr:AAA family ATPase [Bryobacterales bacterium]
MSITRLLARGVGPFEQLDLNFAGADGKPDPGPHVLIGASGAGKTTALRALCWVLAGTEGCGFPLGDFRHAMAGRASSSAAVVFGGDAEGQEIQLAGRGTDEAAAHALWLNNTLGHLSMPYQPAAHGYVYGGEAYLWASSRESGNLRRPVRRVPLRRLAAAYSAQPALKFLADPRAATEAATLDTSLSFDATVENAIVQSWLVTVFTKSALAAKQGLPGSRYEVSLRRFEQALRTIFDEDVWVGIDYEETLQPLLCWRGRRLNMAQLPDGVRTIMGWLADFMIRQERDGTDQGVLMIDEVDAHCHPAWQARILPALRTVFPDVQIIVSTHSPHVMNSCPDARVHLLEMCAAGQSRALAAQDGYGPARLTNLCNALLSDQSAAGEVASTSPAAPSTSQSPVPRRLAGGLARAS